MPKSTLPTEQILRLLREMPQRFSELTAPLSHEQLSTPLLPGEWSLNEILAHLRSCADVWDSCMTRILAQNAPTIQAIHPSAWIKQTDYPGQDFRDSLRAFTQQRAELLTVLEPLPEADWQRTATVTGAGSPLRRTIHTYAQWLATHERSHLNILRRIFAV